MRMGVVEVEEIFGREAASNKWLAENWRGTFSLASLFATDS